MNDKNKILLVGPPESGKTTIIEVFFKKANPLLLLKNPLEPTRGINSDLYTFFNSQIGIFDLAGQENQYWFSNKQDIFEEANIIICVFDIISSVESIVSFIIKVLRTKKQLNSLSESKIFVLIHKIDLVSSGYCNKKVKLIEKFKKQFPMSKDLQIFCTSINREFFYKSFQNVIKILKRIELDVIPISDSDFMNLQTELDIMLNIKPSRVKSIDKLSSEFELSKEELFYHFKRLKKLGLIRFSSDKSKVDLTIRSEFLLEKLKKKNSKIGINKKNRSIELLYTLSNLYTVPTETI
jgi:small GTP-binding protein